MTALPSVNGWLRHLLLTIALNFASPQAIVYGYLVPVLFLLAFGSVFRTDSPALQAPGSVGIQGYLSGTATVAPVVLRFDNFQVDNLG